MAQTESIADVLARQGSIAHLWKIIDPKNQFPYQTCLDEWSRMSLTEQRRMYLYLLYKKWRGEAFYGTPHDIITNCQPYPTNWNGRSMINTLVKSDTKLVIARFKGSFGTYTLDEAHVWQMTDLRAIN